MKKMTNNERINERYFNKEISLDEAFSLTDDREDLQKVIASGPFYPQDEDVVTKQQAIKTITIIELQEILVAAGWDAKFGNNEGLDGPLLDGELVFLYIRQKSSQIYTKLVLSHCIPNDEQQESK